jgi:hypothetical protein
VHTRDQPDHFRRIGHTPVTLYCPVHFRRRATLGPSGYSVSGTANTTAAHGRLKALHGKPEMPSWRTAGQGFDFGEVQPVALLGPTP